MKKSCKCKSTGGCKNDCKKEKFDLLHAHALELMLSYYLKRCIYYYLVLKGWDAEPIFFKSKNSSTDVSATIQNIAVKIEVRYGKCRRNEKQKQYPHAVERSGEVYVIVKTIDQFLDWYKIFTHEE